MNNKEKLENVKKGSNSRKNSKEKLKRWSYGKAISNLKIMCEERGIMLAAVSPAYMSQKYSKESRKGEQYLCMGCGYEIDADYNAAINILNKGTYRPPALSKE